MNILHNPHPIFAAPRFSPQEFHYELMKTIVTAHFAFRTIEHPQFRQLINLLRFNIIVLSAYTQWRTMYDYAHTIHLQRKDLIVQNMQVHLAIGTCTLPNKLAFAVMTVHFLDNNWNLRAKVIGFQSLVASSHTGKFLAEKLMEIVSKFNVAAEMLCLGTDNGQSNYVLARELQTTVLGAKWQPEQIHLPCLAHVSALASKAFIENLKSLATNEIFHLNSSNPDASVTALYKYAVGFFRSAIFKVSS